MSEPLKVSPRILMPLPDHDFDPTEVSIPWKECASHGWSVEFSTQLGNVAQADPSRVKGPLPGLLSASAKVQAAYEEMVQQPAYQHPIPYAEIEPDHYQALLLPGGDGPGMRQYLENPVLQSMVLQFFRHGKLVGAICHGILVLARTLDPDTGKSVLYGHKVTVLPRSLDRTAYLLDTWLTRRGYIMYPRCVAEEVRDCLERPEDFIKGPGILVPYSFTDGNLITSRWFPEAEHFARSFAGELERRMQAEETSWT